MTAQNVLDIEKVGISFGGINALTGVSFSVGQGEICGLIGPNGAGKTTLFNCITRVYEPTVGSIRFQGADLLAMRPHRIVGAGIARTFQNLALFPSMSVLENTMSGASALGHTGFVASVLGLPASRRAHREIRQHAWELLERLDLIDVALEDADGLPFGTLKRVELARALIARPQLLLLDEPAGGLTHSEVDELGVLIKDLSRSLGFSVLLVEHHMGLVMGISDSVVALDFGRVLAQGAPREVQENPDVVASYLGKAA
ncbi:ABC transporter ATP-binding protein [Aeromicrobium sp. Leaf350]|uniref:ABC transporter ATP-binding protein n=1 Tax=Aeromicrobium sp. Leaf350 TaxID=2876565 RepID=UPI001E3FBB54|nr:ABC transporter ATP-binding protein [Aeromicrobium sp. Leaf350]